MHAAFGASAQACIIPTSKSGEPLGSLYATAYRRAALIRAAASISRWGLHRVCLVHVVPFRKVVAQWLVQGPTRPVVRIMPYSPLYVCIYVIRSNTLCGLCGL